MCIRSGSVGQVSYRDSRVPCRRRHSYSGISPLRFPFVFLVACCLVFILSSALRVSFMFGNLSVVRCYRYRLRCSCSSCRYLLRCVAPSFLVAPFLRSCVIVIVLAFRRSLVRVRCVVIVSFVRLVRVWFRRFSCYFALALRFVSEYRLSSGFSISVAFVSSFVIVSVSSSCRDFVVVYCTDESFVCPFVFPLVEVPRFL